MVRRVAHLIAVVQARDGARSIGAPRRNRNGAVRSVEGGGVWGWWASANVVKQDLAPD